MMGLATNREGGTVVLYATRQFPPLRLNLNFLVIIVGSLIVRFATGWDSRTKSKDLASYK